MQATLLKEENGICFVQLRAFDGIDWNLRLRDDTNLDSFVIQSVAADNTKPVADAASDQDSAITGEQVTLDGSSIIGWRGHFINPADQFTLYTSRYGSCYTGPD
jgi:hypothetical protein